MFVDMTRFALSFHQGCHSKASCTMAVLEDNAATLSQTAKASQTALKTTESYGPHCCTQMPK